MEDDNPEDLHGSQEVAGESKDRPPLEVVDLTAETKVPTDGAEEEPAPENVEPLPVHEPLWEIDPSAGHQVSGQCQECYKIPLFSPNSLIFLNLCFVILFRSPSLH